MNREMDTFCEQLVKIKKTAGTVALTVLLYVLAFLLIFLCVTFALSNRFFMSVVIIAAFLIVWGLGKAVKMLYVEYEYIITNDEMDIDRITGKDKRSRLITFNLRQVEQVGVYNAAAAARLKNRSFSKRLFCCNVDDENRLYIITRQNKGGQALLVLAPNEKTAHALERVVPKSVVYR